MGFFSADWTLLSLSCSLSSRADAKGRALSPLSGLCTTHGDVHICADTSAVIRSGKSLDRRKFERVVNVTESPAYDPQAGGCARRVPAAEWRGWAAFRRACGRRCNAISSVVWLKLSGSCTPRESLHRTSATARVHPRLTSPVVNLQTSVLISSPSSSSEG